MLKEFKTLGPYIRKYLPFYILGVFFLVITDAGQLVLPLMISEAVDLIAAGGDLAAGTAAGTAAGGSTAGGAVALVGRLMLRMIAVAGAIAAGRFGWRLFIHGASRRIENELRNRLYGQLLRLSSKFFKTMKTGDIMSRFTNDMDAIRQAIGMALVSFVDGVFMTLVILVILFSRYPVLAAYTIIPVPLVFFLVLLGGKLLGPRHLAVQQNFARISNEAQEGFSGIRVIKTFVREKFFLSRFETANEAYLQSNLELVKVWGFLFPLVTFLSGLTSFLLLLVGGGQVILGVLSPGDFVAVLSYLGMLIWPMMGAAFTINMLNRGAVSLGRVNRILREEPDIRNLPGAEESLEPGTLEVKDLHYTYPDGTEPVLRGISFTVAPGETLGILGTTGSGKTTLLKLLPRLLDVPPGTIFYSGRDIREYDLEVLRRAFASVPQGTFLFSASVRDNIAFGDLTLDESEREGGSGCADADERLKELTELAALDRDLTLFPQGWNTQVGEKGLTLSGGQKQRAAIARALAVNPDLLIFDDALSAVDTDTEERILLGVLEHRRRTAPRGNNIIVSHRVSTLMKARQVLVLEGGQIVQRGTPADLLEEEGIFRRIYLLQLSAGSVADPAAGPAAGDADVPDGGRRNGN